MDKQKIINLLIDNVESEIAKAKTTLDTTKNLASEEDMKAESKWDTRATEAKFLASGQLKRVEELKLELQMLEEIIIPEDNGSVSIGSLVDVEFNNIVKKYFISPTAGGTMLSVEETPILVISVFSPIGSELINLTEGEAFEVETPKESREYKVLKIT